MKFENKTEKSCCFDDALNRIIIYTTQQHIHTHTHAAYPFGAHGTVNGHPYTPNAHAHSHTNVSQRRGSLYPKEERSLLSPLFVSFAHTVSNQAFRISKIQNDCIHEAYTLNQSVDTQTIAYISSYYSFFSHIFRLRCCF